MNPKFRVITEYYNASTPERQFEIENCLQYNLENKYIDEVVLFVYNTECVPMWANSYQKLLMVQVNKRPSIYDFMFFVSANSNSLDINCIQNSDIYWDEHNVLLTKSNLKQGEFWALTRYDVNNDGSYTFFDRVDSQDAWLYIGGGVLENTKDLLLGIPGIDNALAKRMEDAGCKVINPSITIKTYHLHLTNQRSYVDIKGVLKIKPIPPPYKLLPPTTL